ncbi:hypothetical protein [Thermocrinis sp.]|jgi:hypothetical protein|uniref:hypothetical protein n=1 Tax=Thermocrinis sp. TaxID=2024383 RepID=UPI003BFC0835
MDGYIYNFIRKLEELVLLQEKSVNIILHAKSIKPSSEVSMRISLFYLDIFEMLSELLSNIEFLEEENKKSYLLELALESLSLTLVSLPFLSSLSPMFADEELAKDIEEVVVLLEDMLMAWDEEKVRMASQYMAKVYQLLRYYLYSASRSYQNMS